MESIREKIEKIVREFYPVPYPAYRGTDNPYDRGVNEAVDALLALFEQEANYVNEAWAAKHAETITELTTIIKEMQQHDTNKAKWAELRDWIMANSTHVAEFGVGYQRIRTAGLLDKIKELEQK